MRNALLPLVSPNFDFGNDDPFISLTGNINYELQIFNDTLQNSISGFCLDSKEFDNNDEKQQTVLENCPFSYHSSLVTYQSPAFPISTSISSCDVDYVASSDQQAMLLGKIFAPQLEMNFPTIRNTRKRPMENNDILPRHDMDELLGDHVTVGSDEQWGKNKRSKMENNDQQWKHQMRDALTTRQHHKLQVPVKKSQRLANKITALQKLVSPYGKTDTASVLQEASLYIKLLQEQIQNLFRMLSSSCDSFKVLHSQENGKRELDLSSKGLCLVPMSFTQKIKFEEQIDRKYQRY